jgi:hypothetical protein
VDDEAEVGLVVAHAQRAGGDHRLEVIGEQPLLDRNPRVGVHLPAVRLGCDVVSGEPLRHELGVALGQRVDDPRAVELGQPRREPSEPIRPPWEIDHLQPQARTPQRPPVGLEFTGMPDLQLIGYIGHHAVVGRRRRAQHRDARRQPLEHLRQPPVVRAKIVAPVRDAVRLIDHQEPNPLDEQRQHGVAELPIVQPLGADEQQVHRVLREKPLHLLPCIPIGRVDRVSPNPKPLGRRDLVAHQRQQRRHDQSRPSPPLAQQRGGDEVDRRLPPPRPLHAQHARAVVDQVPHGFELVGTEGGVGAGELAEEGGRAVFEGHGCHHNETRARLTESLRTGSRLTRRRGRAGGR